MNKWIYRGMDRMFRHGRPNSIPHIKVPADITRALGRIWLPSYDTVLLELTASSQNCRLCALSVGASMIPPLAPDGLSW